jgi:hypothetical protein
VGFDVTVVIPAYGDAEKWFPLAERARDSAFAAGSYHVITVHEPDLMSSSYSDQNVFSFRCFSQGTIATLRFGGFPRF